MPLNTAGANAFLSAPSGGAVAGAAPPPDYDAMNTLGIQQIREIDPDLADSVQRARDTHTQHSDSLMSGLWNSVTAGPRKLLEGLDNVSTAFAEPFRDEVEGKEDNAIKDIWQGLSGDENGHWQDNLTSYGMKDGWTKTVLGLAGDVVLDPTNLVGAGGLGMARAAVSGGARELAEHAATGLLKNELGQVAEMGAAKVAGASTKFKPVMVAGTAVRNADDVAAIVAKHSRAELEVLGVHPEMIDAMSGIAAGNADRTIMKSVDDIAQAKAAWIGKTFGDAVVERKSVKALGPQLVDPFGQTWRTKDITDIFTKTQRFNPKQLAELGESMYGVKNIMTDPANRVLARSAQQLGRKAAAATGGVRLRFGVPFGERMAKSFDNPWLAYRWQSGAAPLINRFKVFGTEISGTKMGDFFRGTSGINRLDTAIQQSLSKGDGVWKRDDITTLLKDGLTGLEREMVARGQHTPFKQLFGNKGTSMLIEHSARAGAATAHLTFGARMYRATGQIGVEAANTLRMARVGQSIFREATRSKEVKWSAAARQLKHAVKGGANEEEIFVKATRYLEGIDEDLTGVPDYLHGALKDMKKMYPESLTMARGMGADIGSISPILARKHSDTLLKAQKKQLSQLTRAYLKAQTAFTDAAKRVGKPGGNDLDTGIAAEAKAEMDQLAGEMDTAQGRMAKVLEAQKTTELEIAAMDDHVRQLKLLQGPKAGSPGTPTSYFHRRVTGKVKEALNGANMKSEKNWGAAKQLTAQQERILATMSLEEATDFLRKSHPEALTGVNQIFETNIFNVMGSYLDELSEAVYRAKVKGGAEHFMGALGGVDNGLAMRTTAHVPKDMYPRNAAHNELVASGEIARTNKPVSDTIDEFHEAIGARVHRTAHAEGRAAWAQASKDAGQDVEPWRKGTIMDDAGKSHPSGEHGEYLDIDDVEDLVNPGNWSKVKGEAAGDEALEGLSLQEILRRGDTGSQGYGATANNIEEFMEDVRLNGWKEPIRIDYNPKNGGLVVGNGHHRLLAAERLAKEDPRFRYIPTVITREGELEKPITEGAFGFQKVLDEAHRNGAHIDWEQWDTVPEIMRPSDLFTIASGRLGKVGDLSQDEAFKMQMYLHEMNRASAQAKGLAAKPEVAFQKLGRDFDASKWARLSIPGLEDFVMHPFMASEFNKAFHGTQGVTGGWAAVQKGWRKHVMGPWKKGATIYFPGFHFRNFVGAYFNNWIGGVTDVHYQDGMHLMDVYKHGKKSDWYNEPYSRMRIEGETRVVSYGELARKAQDTGIANVSSTIVADLRNFMGESSVAGLKSNRPITSKMAIGKVGRYRSKTFGDVTLAEGAMRSWESAGMGAMQTTENFHRTAAWLKGMEDSGGDLIGARQFVMMRHGDYDELTDFENGIRDLIPFYKWMRTNIPFQMRQLIESPGKSLFVGDVQRAMVSDEDREKMGGWMRDTLQIPLPKGIAKMLGSKDGAMVLTGTLPIHDLYMGSNEFASSFLPVARQVVLENALFKKQLFSGAPLEGTEKKEVASWLPGPIARIMAKSGIGEEGEDGKVFLTDKERNLLGVFPIFARSQAFLTEDENRKSARYAGFMSMVLGARPEQAGVEAMSAGEREWFYDILDPTLQGLRNVGYVLPTATDLGLSQSSSGPPAPTSF